MDLTKDTIRSDSTDAQESMGVIDPLDAKVTTLEGRGKRITLRDASEKVLADIIIGNEIKGTERKDGGAMHYVRVPGQKRIYGVNIKAEPSTRFADWIETNLLKVEASQDPPRRFRQLQDPGRSRPIAAAWCCSAARNRRSRGRTESGPWAMDDLPAGQELVEDKLRALTDALGDLKIVGVRPRPPGLKKLDQEDLKLSQLVAMSAPEQGVLPDAAGTLLRPGRRAWSRPTRGSSTPCATAGPFSPKAMS